MDFRGKNTDANSDEIPGQAGNDGVNLSPNSRTLTPLLHLRRAMSRVPTAEIRDTFTDGPYTGPWKAC